MNFFVTGVNGQLGHDVMNELLHRGHTGTGSDITTVYQGAADGTPVTSASYVQLDITDSEAVSKVISSGSYDVIVHCAAWTAVDAAEDTENREKVHLINVDGTRFIALAANACGAKMIYISTDYVFSGQGTEPWNADCKDFKPLNYYGQTKLEGELAVSSILNKYFIVRTEWVFGLNGHNFIKTILRLSEKYDTLRVVNDQIGTPTYTYDLARLLVDMAETEYYGFYNASNEGGYISWADFAAEICRQSGKTTIIQPVTTEEYGLSKAARPHNSRLNMQKLRDKGFTPLPIWQDALSRYLSALLNS